MVHALREAHRVLKPNGLLLDLRPAPVHRRINLDVAGRTQLIAIMDESLEDDYAANHAVTAVIQAGLFNTLIRNQVDCRRVMGKLKDFESWALDFSTDRQASQERLVKKVNQAYYSNKGKRKVFVNNPLVLKVLRKI